MSQEERRKERTGYVISRKLQGTFIIDKTSLQKYTGILKVKFKMFTRMKWNLSHISLFFYFKYNLPGYLLRGYLRDILEISSLIINFRLHVHC